MCHMLQFEQSGVVVSLKTKNPPQKNRANNSNSVFMILVRQTNKQTKQNKNNELATCVYAVLLTGIGSSSQMILKRVNTKLAVSKLCNKRGVDTR